MDRRRSARWFAAALAGVALLSGCTGGDGRTELNADDDGFAESAALAADNGFATASPSLDGMTAEGLGLQVEYFEALRKGDWVAPDHCWFPTRVSVNGMLTSPGFRGPSSDDDRDAGDGVLVGAISTSVAPDGPLEGDPAAQGGPGPEGTPGVEQSDGPTMTTLVGGPIDAVDPAGAVPATVVVAAVFGHDQVAELSSEDEPAIEGRTNDTAPVDGWALLSVALEPQALGDRDEVLVRLRRVGEDGQEHTEDLTIELRSRELQVPEQWQFDLSAVDDSCVPPDGESDNEAPTPESDLFGSPISAAPVLPAAGQPPADPTGATSEGLAALRAVYDLGDVYAESKKEFVEDPEDWMAMRKELLVNDVVRPFMSALDPVFRNSVFVSPTELHVLYRVGPSYQWEIGRVLLIDGRWRVANGTVCRDLSAAGYHCKNSEPDPPPGPLG